MLSCVLSSFYCWAWLRLSAPAITLLIPNMAEVLVAGNVYDGRIYHQDPIGRSNGKWVLEPVSGEPEVFFIRDTKHNKYIVAGDRYDGRVYHQLPNNRSNAKWRLVPLADNYGSKTFHLIDQKHNRAIVAGDVADNNVYHQYPDRRPNSRWALVPNFLCCSCSGTNC